MRATKCLRHISSSTRQGSTRKPTQADASHAARQAARLKIDVDEPADLRRGGRARPHQNLDGAEIGDGGAGCGGGELELRALLLHRRAEEQQAAALPCEGA